jgi:hypothetical protein
MSVPPLGKVYPSWKGVSFLEERLRQTHPS